MPTLRTPRLTLAPLRPGDERHLWPFLSCPVTLWAWPQPLDWAGVADWIEGSLEAEERFGLGRHLLRDGGGAVVGDAGFFPWAWEGETLLDVGWVVRHRHWRQGYATEAVAALLAAARARGLRRAVAKMGFENEASRRTAERLGFRRRGWLRYPGLRQGRMWLYERDLQSDPC